MVDKKYQKIVSRHKPSENRTSYSIRAFFIGGMVGSLGEVLIQFYTMCFHISRVEASVFMIVTLIFIAAFLTALGVFDYLVNYARCGLLIPITGFAHSMQSAALEYRNEGLVYGTDIGLISFLSIDNTIPRQALTTSLLNSLVKRL